MGFNILDDIKAHGGDRFDLHDRHLNAAFVRMLKTIGFDVGFDRGEGQYLYDQKGERYLDLLSGFGVFAIGRNHPTVARSLHDVIDANLANLAQFDVSVLSGVLARRLLARVPYLDRAFFCNSGTEAVEASIKFARAATGRARIVYCLQAFHGLTYGALSLNGETLFRDGFGPALADTTAIPFDDLAALEAELAKGDVAAFIVEPLQGKSVQIPSDSYLPEAARLCRRHGALLIADEIQTGLGRTGRFLCVEHWGVEPDMVLLAKALSGGAVPVGAVLSREAIHAKVFDRMDRAVVHGSTFGKNDLAMAAALATLAVIEEENLVARAARMGERIMADFRALARRSDFIKDVRGKGLMIAVEFGSPKSLLLQTGWKLIETANKGLFCQLVLIPLFKRHRVLCQVAGYRSHVIKLIPPLVISDADGDWIRDAFAQAVMDCQHIHSAVWGLGRDLVGHALKAKAG